MPAAGTWDLYGGRRDGEPHLAKLCPSVYLYVCVMRGGKREFESERVRELRGIATHYGCVEG